MSLLIAIDQSTSATKAILFDSHATVLDSVSLEHKQHYPQPGWVEHDAEEIWQNLLKCAGDLCGRNRDKLHDVRGVSITNQRETFVVFERSTGSPLASAVVWQCRRGDTICEELRQAGHDAHVAEKTGLRIDSYFSGSKIAWLMRQRPDIAEAAARGDACVSTIDAYLVHRLTGGAVYATDPTNASRTLLYDIAKRDWDPELCELFDVPRCALPEVRDNTSTFGETNLGGALPASVPICGIMGDSQASLFAQRCFSPGDAKATFGSGTSVLLNIGELQMPDCGAVAALAWVVDGKPTYAWEGLINYSAATIAWLRDQLGLIDSPDQAEQLAQSVDSSEGVYLVPAFSGLSAPYWRPDARAAIVGMTAYTGRAHLVRAALESIALQVRDVVEMLAQSGVRPTSLCVDGGPTRNQLLMQMVADIAQVNLVSASSPNFSALGAAMAGMLGLGMVDSMEQLRQLPRDVTVYKPRIESDRLGRLVDGWHAAVESVLH